MKMNRTPVLLGLMLLVLATATVHADPAMVIRGDGTATIPDGNGDAYLAFGRIQVVVTHNEDGLAIVKATFKNVPNDTGGAVHWDFDSLGASAEIVINGNLYSTDDYRLTISASGQAVFTARFRGVT